MNDALRRYQESLRSIESERTKLKRGDGQWNALRLVIFLVALAAFALSFVDDLKWLRSIAWVLIGAFLVIVTLHQRLRDRTEVLRNRRSVMRRLIWRMEHQWNRLPVWKPSDEQPTVAPAKSGVGPSGFNASSMTPAICDDLDVFGKGSLFQWVSMASTGPGLRTLASWVTGPAIASLATGRAAAAKELAPLRDLRLRIHILARSASTGTADPDHFLNWIEAPSWLDKHKFLNAWSIISPVLILISLVLWLVIGVGPNLRVIAGIVIACVGINAIISTFLLGDLHQIFASAIARRQDVVNYRELFGVAAELPPATPMLVEIRDSLSLSPTSAASAMAALQRISFATSIKQTAILFPVYIVLQMTGLWEIHVLRFLEKWQQKYQHHARAWFESLGQLEAVASVAALHDEYPDHATPTWTGTNDSTQFVAVGLGHPLLPASKRVCNDVTIGPAGTLLLVTGSNMSGKSTMLRSVGLNVLLAGTGAPVCARSMSLPSTQLATSIRVRDNLDEGVSYYMAELKALAGVVKLADQVAAQPTDEGADRLVLLFLLDEILQGTNSRERQIAVAHVLSHLVEARAIGAITTHDLDLADDPKLQQIAHTVHFRETITSDANGEDKMTFDYQMRDGVSPTTNALRLMEMMGLGKPSG